MKLSQLKDKPVVSLANAERLGFVDDGLFNVERHQLMGVRVRRGGLITHRDAVMLADVSAVGDDALTVTDGSRLNAEAKFSDLQGSVPGGQILGSRVLTESGQEIGSVGDIELDPTDGKVQAYLLRGSLIDRLRGQDHPIAVSDVRSASNQVVVVANEVGAA